MSTKSQHQDLPPGQQLVAAGKWPIIGERLPSQSAKPWSLVISGCVTEPVSFTLDQLRSMPQSKLTIDIHCVTRWSKLDVETSGVFLADLLATADLQPNAKFVSFSSRSNRQHATSLSLDTALALQTMIALNVEGEPLGIDHGGPIRNIVPGRYFYKSVKWLEQIELMPVDRLGYWEAESGYHNQADPWKEQRYMAPTIDKRTAIRLIESRDFSNQDLRSIDASQRNLENLNARGASLRDARFTGANLANAIFSDSNLSNAHFHNANLRGANFSNADVEGADFSGADLRETDFSGCSLIGASFFTEENKTHVGAIIDATTILPDSILAPLFPAQLKFVKQKLGQR